jgi:hypothetical protein
VNALAEEMQAIAIDRARKHFDRIVANNWRNVHGRFLKSIKLHVDDEHILPVVLPIGKI